MKKLFYSFLVLAMTALTITSCEDVPAPYDDPNNQQEDEPTVVIDPSGDGTIENPFNVAAANEVIAAGEDLDEKVYVKGIIVSIKEIDTGSYGNATYYISDTGKSSGQLTVYRGYSLGGAKFTSEDEIVEGDTVIVYGQLVNYNGTYEFTQGNQLYSINGKTAPESTVDPAGTGSQADPYNVAAAQKLIASLGADVNSEKVYVKGTIVSIKEIDTGSYGNATYYISDDGTTAGQLTVYRGYSLGNQKFTSESEIKVGDVVVVYGELVNFKGSTPEFTQGNYIYSLNGKTSGGSSEGGASGSGTQADPYNVTKALAVTNGLSADTKSDNVYIKGKISSIKEVSTSYGNATYYISDDGTTENQMMVFRGYYLDNVKFTAEDQIKVGDEVVIYGQLVNYKGNTPEVAQGNYIYSLNSGSSSASVGLDINFTEGQGSWTIVDKTLPSGLTYIWQQTEKYGMKASGYANSTNYDAESWLVSPAFSLAGKTSATLSISHAINYFSSIDVAKTQAVVMASTDGTNWTELTLSSWPSSMSWTFVDATADMSAFAGKSNVQIALKYVSTSSKAGTWEVKTISVK